MNHIFYIVLVLVLVLLGLGISFTILKLNNDDYIENEQKTNPQFTNNKSEIYLAISILSFVLFLFFSIILVFLVLKNIKKGELPSTPLLIKPIMSYDTPKDYTPTPKDDTTPNGISSSGNYMNFSRGENIPKLKLEEEQEEK